MNKYGNSLSYNKWNKIVDKNANLFDKNVLNRMLKGKKVNKSSLKKIYEAEDYFFKELNDLPMSTTWVFVGLLAGRELAIAKNMTDYKFDYVFPIIAKDFGKMMLGLGVSVAIVLLIHYYIVPNGLYPITITIGE